MQGCLDVRYLCRHSFLLARFPARVFLDAAAVSSAIFGVSSSSIYRKLLHSKEPLRCFCAQSANSSEKNVSLRVRYPIDFYEHIKPLDEPSKSESEPREKHKLNRSISMVDKRKFLVNTLLDLKNSRENVYGTLDAWVAWEQNFPLANLKRALIILEKNEQWHRVVQVLKWMLSKGQGTTMGTYEQLIRALEKDSRPEEAHSIWVKKISYDMHSVPWRVCELMISIYYRNNMPERLVKLFKGLEENDRKPPWKSIVRKVADAYELLGLHEEKNKILDKYSSLFTEPSEVTSKNSRKFSRKHHQKSGRSQARS